MSDALGKIQRNRKYHNAKPTTGLEDGPLKMYLDQYLKDKRARTNLLDNKNANYGSEIKQYEDIILRLINSAEKQKRTQVELLIDGYKEMTKENLDIEKEWSKTDIDWD